MKAARENLVWGFRSESQRERKLLTHVVGISRIEKVAKESCDKPAWK